MVYKGRVVNGAIVLDEPVTLPEGVAVRIELTEARASHDDELGSSFAERYASVIGKAQGLPEAPPAAGDDSGSSFTERYAEFIGKAEGLPEDAAENHDHYLYGTPKR